MKNDNLSFDVAMSLDGKFTTIMSGLHNALMSY